MFRRFCETSVDNTIFADAAIDLATGAVSWPNAEISFCSWRLISGVRRWMVPAGLYHGCIVYGDWVLISLIGGFPTDDRWSPLSAGSGI